MLADMGEEGQTKLLAARVLVIGAGGLGSALISYLAAAGVGQLGIIDDDRVELSNLARQIIHETGDIGRLKVDSAADRVAELNPDVRVTTYPFALTAKNAGEIIGGKRSETESYLPLRGRVGVGASEAQTEINNAPLPTSPHREEERTHGNEEAPLPYDIVADGCDNFGTRFIANAQCIAARKPLVSAAIAGWAGNVMTIAPHLMPGSGCYQCFAHPDAPEANTCRDSGIIGPLAGIVGSMQALEIVNAILGRPALVGKIAHYDAKTMQQRISSLPRDPACTVCGH